MLGYGQVAERYPHEMPRMLREAGYHTLGIGKMHWHPQRNLHGFHRTLLDESGRIESPGFISDYRQWFRAQAPELNPDATGIGWNEYRSAPYALPEHLHPTRWTGDRAVEFLDDYRDAEPFFLKVSFARPHSPYDPPERFIRMYQDAALPSAAVGAWAERHAHRGETPSKDAYWGDLGAEQVRRSRQAYYGSVSFIDEQVGRILDSLQRRGLLENTLILFTADHGDMLGDHNLWRKTYPYESSARVPLLLRWPEGMAGRRGQATGPRAASRREPRTAWGKALPRAGQPPSARRARRSDRPSPVRSGATARRRRAFPRAGRPRRRCAVRRSRRSWWRPRPGW
jgi:arylsulfatase A-like enzyme